MTSENHTPKSENFEEKEQYTYMHIIPKKHIFSILSICVCSFFFFIRFLIYNEKVFGIIAFCFSIFLVVYMWATIDKITNR